MYLPVMVMVFKMMCMEGLSHRDTLPRPPLWVGEGGCSCIVFALCCCFTGVWIGRACMYACLYEWTDACMYVYICVSCMYTMHVFHVCIPCMCSVDVKRGCTSYKYMYMYVSPCVCMNTHVCVHVYVCISVYIYVCV